MSVSRKFASLLFVAASLLLAASDMDLFGQQGSTNQDVQKVIEVNLIGDAIAAELKSISQECGLKKNQEALIQQVLRNTKVKSNQQIEIDLIFFAEKGGRPLRPKSLRRTYSGLSLKVSRFSSLNEKPNVALVYIHQLGDEGDHKSSSAFVYHERNGQWATNNESPDTGATRLSPSDLTR